MKAGETLTRIARSLPAPSPSRDLVFCDALVALVAVFVAFAARAAVDSAYPLAWSGVGPYATVALPLCVAALVLAAAGAGLYGEPADRATFLQHATAVAYAAALVALADVYWSDSPLMLALLPGILVALAGIHLARRAYWRRWVQTASPNPG